MVASGSITGGTDQLGNVGGSGSGLEDEKKDHFMVEDRTLRGGREEGDELEINRAKLMGALLQPTLVVISEEDTAKYFFFAKNGSRQKKDSGERLEM